MCLTYFVLVHWLLYDISIVMLVMRCVHIYNFSYLALKFKYRKKANILIQNIFLSKLSNRPIH